MKPDQQNKTDGCLYVVATPIGNLEDITLRALNTLKACDLILAEDTRNSGRLLKHYGIDKPLLSCHEHNESARAPEVVARIEQGARMALISDAGTPAVSDPGYRLVKAVAEAGLAITPIPGANAAVTAISAAGLPSSNFAFVGFAPKKNKARQAFLERYRTFPGTLIFYESPHRVVELLAALRTVFGERPATLCRELTKLYEEFLRGGLSDVLLQLERRDNLKGECVVLLDNSEPAEPACDLTQLMAEIEAGGDMGASRLARELACKYHISKSEVYQQILQIRAHNYEKS